MNHSSSRGNVFYRELSVFFFVSGALGLIYQILWLRKLLLVFGSTVHAVSTVLTVFFGGLALGSWLFGRRIDRSPESGLRFYAFLEAGIGLFAFITLPLFDWMERLYIPIYQASLFSSTVLVGASFIGSVLILLIPATFMGGTFPVLSRFLITTSKERGIKIAHLYGLNTAGAMVGTLLVYHFGLQYLGLFRTLLCAGVSSLGIGLLCFLLDQRLRTQGVAQSAEPQSESESEHIIPSSLKTSQSSVGHERELRWLLIAFGCSGFSAMVYEVTWTRALSLVLGSSIYAFCMMLSTFLGGIALGSLLIHPYLRRRRSTISHVIGMEIILGIYGLCSIVLFSRLPEWFVRLWPVTGGTFDGLLWLQGILSVLVMLLPTLIMGALFPIVSELLTQRISLLGRHLGSSYAVNTLGGIVGSFLSGFVLIPCVGLAATIMTAALVNLIAGFILYLSFAQVKFLGRRMALAGSILSISVVVGVTLLLPSWKQQLFAAGVYLNPNSFSVQYPLEDQLKNTQILYYRDSLNTTVSVHKSDQNLFLKVGGKTDASSGIDMGTQVLSAHLPLLLHGNAQKALVIGLGSGVTLGHVGQYPLSTIHCAEIDEAVIEAARYFKDYNFAIHDDPRTKIFVADGRHLLLASREQYDVIISEPSNPWIAGLAYLFTQEFYQLAKRRLSANGIMCQWLQLYSIFPQDVKLLLKTFHAEFPYVSVWSPIPGDLLLIGSMQPHTPSQDEIISRMKEPAIAKALEVIQMSRPEVLFELYQMGSQQVEELTADIAWLHQDDMPSVEFSAPRALYAGNAFQLNVSGMQKFIAQPQAAFPGGNLPSDDPLVLLEIAQFWASRNDREKARSALEKSIRFDPTFRKAWILLGLLQQSERNILKSEESFRHAIMSDPTHPEAYRLLGRLYWQARMFPEALDEYLHAAKLKTPDHALSEELGRFYQDIATTALEHSEQKSTWLSLAAECFRSSLSQTNQIDRVALMKSYATVLQDLKQWKMAEQVLIFATRHFPDHVDFPLRLGQVLLEEQRRVEAVDWFKRTLSLNPQNAAAYFGLGRVALADDKLDLAIQHLRRALRYDPYYLDASQLLEALQRS